MVCTPYQWSLVPLWPTLIPKTVLKHQTVAKALSWFILRKLQGINPMGLSYPLDNSYTNKYSETPNYHQNLEMIILKKFQGIKPMRLSDPLANYYPNNCSETPKCHQNLDMIFLIFFKRLTQCTLVPLWTTLIPTTMLKQKTSTKNWDDWLETIQSIDDEKCNDKTGTLTKTPPPKLQGEKICMYSLYMVHRQFAITPEDKF